MKLMINRITVGILVASQFVYGAPVYAEKYISEPSAPFNGRVPVASGLAFDKAVPAIGDTVTLSYIFEDLDGDTELGSTVRWLRDGQLIEGATAFSYTLDQSKGDRPGQRLSAEITPKTDANITEPAVGLAVSIEATVAGNPDAKPVVTVTDIVGTLNQGETLTGKYTYDDNTTGSPDASTLSWVNGGHVSSDAAYVLDADDVGKVLTFEVEAKNQAGTVGNTDRITTATASSVTGGSTLIPGAVINPAAIPSISDLKISGDLKLGSTLTTEYTFNANSGFEVDASLVTWGVEGQTQSLADTGKPLDQTYTLLESDVGLILEASILPRNGGGVAGVVQTVSAKLPVVSENLIKNVSIVSTNTNGHPYTGGQTLTVNYTYENAERVNDDRVLVQWYRNDLPIQNATSQSYKLNESEDIYSRIKVSVLQKSNAGTGYVGDAIYSQSTDIIESVIKPFFLLDNPVEFLTWQDANSACISKGARLPTETELQSLFLRATSATVIDGSLNNFEMCTVHGWTLYQACPAGWRPPGSKTTSNYWSSTKYAGNYLAVSMRYGGSAGISSPNSKAQVACVP